jgi:hypothetical protein
MEDSVKASPSVMVTNGGRTSMEKIAISTNECMGDGFEDTQVLSTPRKNKSGVAVVTPPKTPPRNEVVERMELSFVSAERIRGKIDDLMVSTFLEHNGHVGMNAILDNLTISMLGSMWL